MAGVGTEVKMVGKLTKLSGARWGKRIIVDHGGSVKTHTILRHKCTLALLFSFGGVKKI